MSKHIFIFTIAFVLLSITTFSCKTPAEKVEDNRENVENAENKLEKSLNDSAAAANEIASKEEWEQYKDLTKLAIRANEIRIKELRNMKRVTGDNMDITLQAKIDSLESKNKILENKLDNYDKSRGDWGNFKKEFNRDLDELGKSLKEFTITRKK